jgi:putative sensory transduction regulator
MLRRTLSLVAALALTAPAGAQTIVTAEDPDRLVAIIQALGFQARLEEDSIGDPLIRSSSNGVDFSIQFYGCTKNKRCRSLHFTAGYDLEDGASNEAIEEWNQQKRFASAYLDNENDPFLQMDVNLEKGVTQQNFESTFDLWQDLKAEFEDHINFKVQVSSRARPDLLAAYSRGAE